MDVVLVAAGIVIAGGVLWGIQYLWPRPRIVQQHERALRFRLGHLIGELGPGRYWIRDRIERLIIVDTRRRHLIISGQEVLTSDRVPLKISVVTEYSVSDVTKAFTIVDKYQEVLYARVQLALRQAVAQRDLDAALTERGELGQALVELVRDSALEFGVTVHAIEVRDFMMAGGLRNAYADVVQAKQQGLAALERARGESAAIRNLANSAQLLERHPGLMQLRLLQAVEVGSGNRIVIVLDPERGTPRGIEFTAEDDT